MEKNKFNFGEEIVGMISRGGVVGLVILVIASILMLNLVTPFLAGWFPSLNNLPSSGGAIQLLLLFVIVYMFLGVTKLVWQAASKHSGTQYLNEYLKSTKSMIWTSLIIVGICVFLIYAIAEGWIGIDFSIVPKQFSIISP